VLEDTKDIDLSPLLNSEAVPPQLDVHSHAAELQRVIVDVLKPQRAKRSPRPHKKSMSEDTWQLILEKRHARAHLAELNKRQRTDLLEMLFGAWKQRTPVPMKFVADFNKLLSMQDALIAKALSTFRHLGRTAVGALRRDDQRFFQALLAESGDHLAPGDVKRFWAIIRRSLPKFKQRRANLLPPALKHLRDRLCHICVTLRWAMPLRKRTSFRTVTSDSCKL